MHSVPFLFPFRKFSISKSTVVATRSWFFFSKNEFEQNLRFKMKLVPSIGSKAQLLFGQSDVSRDQGFFKRSTYISTYIFLTIFPSLTLRYRSLSFVVLSSLFFRNPDRMQSAEIRVVDTVHQFRPVSTDRTPYS